MAGTRHKLRLPEEDPLREDYHISPDCGVLGAGTDGFVVRATAQRSGYSDALKFFRDSANDSEREIQALQAISRHSHVVELLKVYAPCGARTSPVLAFPELHGTLADLVRRGRRSGILRYPLVGELAQQCLEGLAHVHQSRVVHRDLSPSNILVDIGPCANTGRMQFTVKIADFSRARVLPVEKAVEHTGTEQRQGLETYAMTTGLGTLRYSAPELLCCPWQGPFEYGVGVDIWAFGAIWFEVLNRTEFMPGASDAKKMAALTCRLGECPTQIFRGSRYELIREAAQKHVVDLQDEVLPLSSYKIPGQAGWEVLAAALQWNPSLRPSAAALAQKPWMEENVADDGTPAQSSPQEVPAAQLSAQVLLSGVRSVAKPCIFIWFGSKSWQNHGFNLLYVCYLHVICMLFVWYLYVICVLSAGLCPKKARWATTFCFTRLFTGGAGSAAAGAGGSAGRGPSISSAVVFTGGASGVSAAVRKEGASGA